MQCKKKANSKYTVLSFGVVLITFFACVTNALAGPEIYYADNSGFFKADYDGQSREVLLITTDAPNGIEVTSGKMYWADRDTEKIYRADTDGTDVEELVPLFGTGLQDLAIDSTNSKIYWTEATSNKIRRSNLDGSSIEEIIGSGLDTPTGIEVDPGGGKIYWADSGTDNIKSANLNGTGVTTIISTDADNTYFIALDLTNNKIYWADDDIDKIKNANLDGSSATDIVTGITTPRGIHVDASVGKIYWVNRTGGVIRRANLDGSSAEDQVTLQNTALGVAVAGSKIYWGSSGTQKIQSANTGAQNSGITDLVTNSGFEIPRNNVEVDLTNNKLYVADGATPKISRLNLDFTSESIFLPVTAASSMIVDEANSYLYFTDLLTLRVRRINLDGTGLVDLISSGFGQATVINIDYVLQKLYVTDNVASKIFRADIDGSNVTEILNASDGVSSPTGITISQTLSKIYWANIGGGNIQRADLDGSNAELVLSGLSLPYDINIDDVEGKMYWSENTNALIKRADLDGSNIETLVDNAPGISGFALTLPSTVTLSGTVLDGASSPVAGAIISFDDGTTVTQTTTAADGSYSYSVPRVASYTLTPSSNDYTFSPTSTSGTSGDDFSQNFTAAAATYSISGQITFSSMPTDGIENVTVSDGTRSTTTDSNGNFTLTGVPNGSYTLTFTKDGFSFEESPATVSGSNLSGLSFFGTSLSVLSPLYTFWNGFLSLTNVLELVNRSDDSITVSVTLFDISGNIANSFSVSVNARDQRDIIVSDLPGFIADSYGAIKLEFAGEIDGRLTYYRPVQGSSSQDAGGYEIAYSLPLANATTGNSFVAFNTFQPSLDSAQSNYAVLNWLSIFNQDSQARSFTVKRFNQTGELLSTQSISVPALGRLDIAAGHDLGPDIVGLMEIIPGDDAAPYQAQIVRYGSTSQNGVSSWYTWAFPLKAQAGGPAEQWVPISSGGNAQNWIEVSNVSESAQTVTITYFDSAGNTLAGTQDVISLKPKRQLHFEASARLPSGGSGAARIQTASSGNIVVNSMFYFRDSSNRVDSMYGVQSRGALDGTLTGSWNLFLDQSNWLRIFNTGSSSESVTITVFNEGSNTEQTISLGAKSGIDLGLHQTTNYGTSENAFGLVTVAGSNLMADLLRIKNTTTNAFDFVFPTKMRP